MCATGIRDMSLLKTPPSGRLKVETRVATRNDEQMIEAVQKELARGGQVFYVVPRIDQVQGEVDLLERLLPESATVSFAYSGLRDLEARIGARYLGSASPRARGARLGSHALLGTPAPRQSPSRWARWT